MTRTAQSFNTPHDPDVVPRLPVVGGPLDGKTRKAEGLHFSRKDWKGEYRRTVDCWQWTPPPGGESTVSDNIARIGLVKHSTPAVMADHTETVAKRIRRDGTQVIRRAAVLASRGLPNNTGGAPGRSSDPTTSTERAAGASGDGKDNDPPVNLTPPEAEWNGIDADLAKLHRAYWAMGLRILAAYDRIQSHASDDDPIPAGTGHCGCGKSCDPRKNPADRLKSNLHPTCHRRYHRWRLTNPGRTVSDYIDTCHQERGETRARPVAGPRTTDEDVA